MPAPVREERIFLPVTPVTAQPAFVTSNLVTRLYHEGAEVPMIHVSSSGPTSSMSIACTLTGREIAAP